MQCHILEEQNSLPLVCTQGLICLPVAVQSVVCTAFHHLNVGIMCTSPTEDIDVCAVSTPVSVSAVSYNCLILCPGF